MKPVRYYMDEAANRGLVKNDAELARRLSISRASVCAWRNGESAPNEDQAAALAALLGKPEIMAECMAARAKKPENRAMWEKLARMCATVPALMMSGILFFAAPQEAAANQDVNGGVVSVNTNYRTF